MSLKHAFTDLVADDPALPTFVRPSNWNEEHTFPGAGAGEVVYVDGDGHAATSGGFVFDSGSQILTVAGQVAVPSINITGATDYFFDEIDDYTIRLGASTLLFNVNTSVLGPGAGAPNNNDLGAVGQEWRTGYFGTSVVSPLYVAGATPGITDTIDLTTATSITVVGGIIVGWA